MVRTMAKVFELGVARITFDNPMNKIPSMVDNMDRMSAQGWELRTCYDAVSEVVVFYQREKTPMTPITGTSPVLTTASIV